MNISVFCSNNSLMYAYIGILTVAVFFCSSCSKNELLSIDESVRLNNIYYEYNEWDILPQSEIDLTILKDLMEKYPDMVIELSSHTDIRGAARYNKSLSQRRAQSAKDWLVQEGLVNNRIIAVGYGEEKIANQCHHGIECSEEEHAFNRRTEFKMIEGPSEIEIKNGSFNQYSK